MRDDVLRCGHHAFFSLDGLKRFEPTITGQVPSRSIVVNEALANAIIAAVSTETGMTLDAFRDNHPGGAIGSSSSRREPA